MAVEGVVAEDRQPSPYIPAAAVETAFGWWA